MCEPQKNTSHVHKITQTRNMHRSITLISILLRPRPLLDKILKKLYTKNLIFLHIFQTQLTAGDFLIVKSFPHRGRVVSP